MPVLIELVIFVPILGFLPCHPGLLNLDITVVVLMGHWRALVIGMMDTATWIPWWRVLKVDCDLKPVGLFDLEILDITDLYLLGDEVEIALNHGLGQVLNSSSELPLCSSLSFGFITHCTPFLILETWLWNNPDLRVLIITTVVFIYLVFSPVRVHIRLIFLFFY